MKIADYGKAITSYIESPTTVQKLQAKEKAQTLGRTLLAEGSEDIAEPSKSMQVDTTTKGLDLFTIDDFKKKAEIYVGAYHNKALPIDDIRSALNKFTQKGIDDGTFSADDAIKIVQDLKYQFQDRAKNQRLHDVIIEGTGTVERKDFQDGLSVQTLDPVFPTKDPTSTDFKPLDIPGAVIPPLAIGAGAKRIKDIFFSKDKDEEKKEIVDRIEKVEKDKKEPDQEPPDFEKIFRDVKTLNEFNKYFKDKEKDIQKVPTRFRLDKIDKEYLTAFEKLKNKHFDGSVTATVKHLNEELKMGTNSFKNRIRFGTKENPGIVTYPLLEDGLSTSSVLDIKPSENNFKTATNIIRNNPKLIKEKVKSFIKDGTLKNNEFYNLKTLADVFGIDKNNEYAVQTLGTNLKNLGVDNKKGVGLNKTERFFKLNDAILKLTEWSKSKQAYGQGTGVVAPRERYLILKKLDNPLRNLFNRFNQQIRKISKDVNVYQAGALEDIGHPLSIKIGDKYSDLLKGSNINNIQTLVFQDPVVNQNILIGEGFENQYYDIFDRLKMFKNKKITKENRLDLLNIKKEMEDNYNNIIKSIVDKQKDNSYFIGQEKRIPKITLNVPKIGETFKGSDIFADMSTVDSEFIVGKVSNYNNKAKKYNQLSNKEKTLYKENLKDQFSDSLEKYYTAFGYATDEITDLLESFETGTDQFMRLPKSEGGPVYGKYAGQIAKLS